jgi:Ca2+-binding RTX toxin-like protein
LSYKSETALVNAKTGTIKVVEGQSGALDGDSTQTGTVKAMSMDAKLLAIQYRHGFGILERKTGVEVYVPFDKVFDDYDRSEYYWYAVHMTADGGHIYVKVEGGDMAVVNGKKTLSRAVTETGTSGGETLTGSEKADVIFGLGGHDILKGLGGADELYGGRGNDKLIGGNGSDTLLGDVGDDILSGGGADDKLIGGSGADKIKGGFGSDMLLGGSGADILQGNAARDILNVGKDTQRDLIVLTKVSDSAKGRANRDQVRNFDPGEDKFDLRKIDAKIGVAGNQKLAFEGTTKSANSVWYSVKSGKVLVLGDVNGDAQADFEIDVLGVTSLQASDFIL